jgi:transcriptional regulator with XRE-family HTH domain
VDQGPALRRRRLGAELKRSREAAGLTQETVSRHFEWHAAKVTRIETGRVAVTVRDVKDLLTLYGVVDEAYHESLIELARKARETPWWSQYRDVERSGRFVGLEAGATAILSWEPIVMPGLLQTEGYTRSLLRAALPSEPPDAVERRIALRLARQARLTGPQPLRLTSILDESVLHRVIGGQDDMAAQLRRVRDAAADLPNVTVRVLPFTAGAHRFLGGSAAILEFGAAADPVVFMEGFANEYEDRPAAVALFREAFDQLAEMALDEHRSLNLIDSLLHADA